MALYSFGELSAISVKGLRALVRKHNLHVALKGYSKMRKTPLIHAFLAKKPAKPTAATAGPSLNPPPAPKKKQAVARVASRTTAVEPSAPEKKQAVSRTTAAPNTPRPPRRSARNKKY